jgi:hypothetical protein
MSLVLQSSGGGSVTIQEPSTASNFTATLPAATGTVVLTGTTPTLNGITFPATQVASADANTLDDYEEGTWTPRIGGAGGNGTLSYSVQQGSYTKIGNMVTCWGHVQASSTVSGGAGNLQIYGLPFASLGGNVAWYTGTIGYFQSLTAYGNSANDIKLLGPDSNQTYLRFHAFTNAGIGDSPGQANVVSGTEFYFSCSYRV